MTLAEILEKRVPRNPTAPYRLTASERLVLHLLWSGGTLMTCAQALRVSRERVRQIEVNAHRKLAAGLTVRRLA